MPKWLSHEPVAWAAAVIALLGAITIVVPIPDPLKAAIIVAVPLVANLFVRQLVAPVAKLLDGSTVIPIPPAT